MLREEIRHCRPLIMFVAVAFVFSLFILVHAQPLPPGEMLLAARQANAYARLETISKETGLPVRDLLAIGTAYNEVQRKYGPM